MNYCQFCNETIKRMCNSVNPILPPEYQHVEYLANPNGLQIDTGRYVQSNNITIYTTIYKTSAGTSEEDFISNQDDASTRFVGGCYNGNWFLYTRNIGSTVNNATIPCSNNIVTQLELHVQDGYKWITKDGVRSEVKTSTVIKNNNQTMVVFCAARRADLSFTGRIYNLTYQEDNIDIFDFIPCYRKSDNKPGMYDLVTNTFFTNAGTGEFTVGNNV